MRKVDSGNLSCEIGSRHSVPGRVAYRSLLSTLTSQRSTLQRLLAAISLGLLFSTAPAGAENILPSPRFLPGSGIAMRITNFYEEIPPFGFLPLRVEVKNPSAVERTWRFQTVHSQASIRTTQYVTSLTVEAGSERTFDLLIPLSPQATPSTRYSNLMISVTGYAVADGTTSEHSSGGGRPPTPFLGMGEALAVKNWGPLQDRMEKKHSKSLDGSAIDPVLIPADWRGLAGFAALIFTEAEWRRIPAAPRNAIQDWIVQGGQLVLCHAGPSAPPDLPSAGPAGSGTISHWPLGDDLVDRSAKFLQAPFFSPATEALQSYSWEWRPAKAVGRPEPPQALIMTFVIAFAVVIGPLNFMVFAPLGRRHRLFWTTPLLSLGASIVMGVFIVLSEGFGGTGRRFEAELSLPDLRKSVLWQEQVSRTGVLTSRSFTLSEPALMLPIGLKQTSEAPHSPHSDRGISYALNGAQWSGDWFRSRTTQAQALTSVLPARGKLEISTGVDGTPSVQSSFAQELREVWYFDASGQAWKGAGAKPGGKLPLVRADDKGFIAWWRRAIEPAGPMVRGRAEGYAKENRAGKFFASTAIPQPIGSLAAIRWNDAEGVIFGQTAQ